MTRRFDSSPIAGRARLVGRRTMPGFLVMLSLAYSAGAAAADARGLDLLKTYCVGCHRERSPNHFERISSIRKTPEGWLMTLFRMRQVHGAALPEPERDTLIRYLADTQGLAPTEAAAGRFELERRPFAGHLDPSGRFSPAGPGLNPARKFKANNAGNLSIVAALKDGARIVTGKGHLIVTVQRWNTPPIYPGGKD